MSSPSRLAAFLAYLRRFQFRVGVGLLVSLFAILWLAIYEKNRPLAPEERGLNVWDALMAIDSNLIASLIAFLIVFGFFQYFKDISREEVLANVVVGPIKEALQDCSHSIFVQTEHIDWQSLFNGTDEILLVVQGWDGWEKRVDECLPAFLQRGGKIRLIVHDPEERELVKAMAKRMSRDENEVKKEIRQTVSVLRKKIVDNVGDAKANIQFEYSYTKQLNWFCGIYFKPGKLLLSLYQHHQQRIGHIESPSFLVRTDVFPRIGQWFEKEWDYLLNGPPKDSET